MTIRLRPHHLLCLLTYVGKGYGEAFTRNYDGIAQRLSAGEPILVVEGPDEICAPLLADPDTHCRRPGVTGRDVTPEAVEAVCDKIIPGFGELFRWLSFQSIGTSVGQLFAAVVAGQSTVDDAAEALIRSTQKEFPVVDGGGRLRGFDMVLLDGDRPTVEDDPLFLVPTHIVFSSECLRATTGQQDLSTGLLRMTSHCNAFLAVSDGAGAVRYIEGDAVRSLPVFTVNAIDTLAAGDVFHAGVALALAEGHDEIAAMRFGSAAAAIKCTRFGGSMGAPKRAEVDALLARG